MMNKRFFSGILLAGYVVGVGTVAELRLSSPASAQTQESGDLYYTFFDQKIPLTLRSDAIAVEFKPVGKTRGVRSTQPLHLQLQQDLQRGIISGTRGVSREGAIEVEVSPLGKDYALVNFPSGTRSSPQALQQQIQQQPYVETTLPVLSRTDSDSPAQIVLPNEIIVSFKPGVSESEKQAILAANNLELIRPLRFSQNRYLVRAKTASGTAILGVANQLGSEPKIQSATPNFIQSLMDRDELSIPDETLEPSESKWQLKHPLKSFFKNDDLPIKSSLLPIQWHLSSTLLATCLNQRKDNSGGLMAYLSKCFGDHSTLQATTTPLPRTDMRVIEAWKNSNQGNGVVIAVIDSLIQWNHPDLAGNLHKVGNVSDRLPGEVSGWDFVENDPDTRISKTELNIVGKKFRDAFLATDQELRKTYPQTFQQIQRKNPKQPLNQVADKVRSILKNNEVAGQFHGTMVAGVVAARPQEASGVVGVAPRAKILPVRVMGLNDSFSAAAYLEGISYAAARGADVINISLGGSIPTQGEAELITEVLKANPKVTIVAAAGNFNQNEMLFPAATSGVVAVGATNFTGNRAPYSNYGAKSRYKQGLTVVAPGGDTSFPRVIGGILTTGGTWLDEFWQGIPTQDTLELSQDAKGKYRWTQGTSFSSPAVAGAIALMKGEDSNRRLSREQLIDILKQTATYDGLIVKEQETKLYNSQLTQKRLPRSVSTQQYFFGSGLVNTDAAVRAVKQKLR